MFCIAEDLGTVEISPKLDGFAYNAFTIVSDCDGYVSSVYNFDDEYIRRFGDYRY